MANNITTYSALKKCVQGLKSGDTFIVGTNNVEPQLLDKLTTLGIDTITVTVTTSNVATDLTVTGTGTIMAMAGSTITLNFTKDATVSGGDGITLTFVVAPTTAESIPLIESSSLSGGNITFTPNTKFKAYFIELNCNINIGGEVIPVFVDIPAYSDPGYWDIGTGTITDGMAITQDLYSALASSFDISTNLPSTLTTLSDFTLNKLELSFNPTSQPEKFDYVYFSMTFTEGWSILGPIGIDKGATLTLDFNVDLSGNGQSYAELVADFVVADAVPIELGAHLAKDNFHVWGNLQQGKTVSIDKLLKKMNVTLPTGFPVVDVDTLSLLVDISGKSFTFDFAMDLSDAGILTLGKMSASFGVAKADSSYDITGNFTGTLVLDNITTLFLLADYSKSGLSLTGKATEVPIGTLITYLTNEAGIAKGRIPAPIQSLVLETLTTTYDTSTGKFTFDCEGKFKVSDTPVEVTFTIDLTKSAEGNVKLGVVKGTKGYDAKFGGSISFDDLDFAVKFDMESGSDMFVATFSDTVSGGADLQKIVAVVSTTLAAEIPDELNAIDVANIKLLYSNVSAGTGDVAASNKKFAFGLALANKISLSELPIIGNKLPPEAVAAVDDMQFLYTSAAFTKADITALNALLPKKGVTPLNNEDIGPGITLGANLAIGSDIEPLQLTIPPKQSGDAGSGETLVATLPGVAPPPTSGAVTLWVNVQKAVGPVDIEKLGVEYKDSAIYVVGDINITVGVLNLGLVGIGVGSEIKKFVPKFTIDGITVSYTSGPVEVSGGLLGTISPINFYGELMVNMATFGLAALGAYSENNGDPSFFLYGVYDEPIGGPSYFFVTGLAAGFGFNRALNIPDVNNLSTFPLVEWGSGQNPPSMDLGANIADQVETALSDLNNVIYPETGEYWIAAGLRFTTFELINSFALVTISLGTDCQFSLLGQSTMDLPSNLDGGEPAIAFVEIDMEATISPDRGIFEVAGALASSSYLLDPNCHLTGGLAFCFWFKDNPEGDADGYHAGDFVYTVGGYNPAFDKPAYYPLVDNVGVNWQIGNSLVLKGGFYYAFTPSCLMAGGSISITWNSGGLRAWFDAYANFLLSWKPYYYNANMGVSIGVSYTIHIWFVHVTITVHVSVNLNIWGPSFGGVAHVDLSIFSFSIDFGASQPSVSSIEWNDFKKSFLPKVTSVTGGVGANLALASGTNPISTDSFCSARITGGLVKTLTAGPNQDINWIVAGDGFSFVTTTVIPANSGTLITGDNTTHQSQSIALTDNTGKIGIGPVNISPDNFKSEHKITLYKDSGSSHDYSYNFDTDAVITPITKNVPQAAWSGTLMVTPSISDINGQKANISDALVGYTVSLKEVAPDTIPPIPVKILCASEAAQEPVYTWTTPDIKTTDQFVHTPPNTVMQKFMTTINTAAVSTTREGILNVLSGIGLDIDTTVDVSKIANDADMVLLSPPILSYLGEEPAAA